MSLDKILTDPVRMLSILIALLSYVYFSHLGDIKDRLAAQEASNSSKDQVIRDAQKQLFELQTTQKQLIGQVADAQARLKDMDKLPLMEQEIGMNKARIDRMEGLKVK